MSYILIEKTPDANIPTPLLGRVSVWFSTTFGIFMYKDDSGVNRKLGYTPPDNIMNTLIDTGYRHGTNAPNDTKIVYRIVRRLQSMVGVQYCDMINGLPVGQVVDIVTLKALQENPATDIVQDVTALISIDKPSLVVDLISVASTSSTFSVTVTVEFTMI